MHDQLHARVVYDFVITFNLGIFFGYIAENGQEHAIAEFHDIGFVDAGHFMTIMGQGVLKSGADDAAAGMTGDDFDGMHFIIIDFFFYAGIEIFCVFTERHQIDVGKWRFDGCVGFCRADIGKEIVFFAQHDINGTESFADRCGNWRFEQDVRLFKGLECGIRHEGTVAFVFSSTYVEKFIIKRGFGSIQDVNDGIGDFRANAIAFKYSNRFHRYRSSIGIYSRISPTYLAAGRTMRSSYCLCSIL